MKYSPSKVLVLLSTVAVLQSGSVKAEESVSNSVFNPEVFSLSKKKESAFDSASATYVLGSEEIRRSGATSIPEALRLVPGVQVARMNGGSWAIAIRGFDRQFSNKLLVMIDGRVVYSQLISGVFWDTIDQPMEDIDRIEVVRGPGGTIWGANAVSGVINIITKSAVQTQGAYVSQIVGNQDKSITEVRFGGKDFNNDSYRVYAKKAVRDGVDKYNTKTENGDGLKQDKAGFRYDISSVQNNEISIHGDIFQTSARNYFGALTSNFVRNDKDSKGANLVLNWDKKISKKSNITTQMFYDYDFLDAQILRRAANTFDFDFQHFYNFSKDNQLIWGLGYRQIADKITTGTARTAGGVDLVPLDYNPKKRNDELYSAFIQDKFGLIADKLYLTVGSKFMINDFTGFEYQPNARMTYYPARNQTVWASVSRAVRTPTRGEDDIDIKNVSNGAVQNLTINRGSDTYQSEELVAYEVGYRIKPTVKTMIDATAFFNDYSKLRTFEVTDGNLATGTPTAANLGSGESYGFEISGKWQVTSDWRLESSYDYLKSTLHISPLSTDNKSVIGAADSLESAEGISPQSQFKLKSFFNITPKIEFDNIIYYVSGLPTAGSGIRNSTNGVAGRDKGIPSYVRFDTRLGYIPTRNLELSLGIQNLFDQRHSEFKASLYNNRTEFGRTFYIKMVWHY
jgi:iron complex outermembrane receptor protein